jgi:hypothetical protein
MFELASESDEDVGGRGKEGGDVLSRAGGRNGAPSPED